MRYNFVKTATAVPAIIAGDCRTNAKEIISLSKELAGKDVELILFPELCLTSGSCGDLLLQSTLLKECELSIKEISEETRHLEPIIVFGAPVLQGNTLYNCAIVMHRGTIKGAVAKGILRNVMTNEARWFASANTIPCSTSIKIAGQETIIDKNCIFSTDNYSFGIEFGNEAESPVPPGATLAACGADIILNPSQNEELAGSHKHCITRITEQSRRYRCGYMHANSGWGESTSHATYAGYNCIAECGNIIAEGERFCTVSAYTIAEIDIDKIRHRRRGDSCFMDNGITNRIHIPQQESHNEELCRNIDATPFIPKGEDAAERYQEIFNIQATALARRIKHTYASTCVIGISGGLDSTLALLVTEEACRMAGKSNSDIIAITMPGFGTSGRTYNNAMELMKSMNVTIKEIPIKVACLQHFKDIEHDVENHDVTYENSQARERTQILMDVANKMNGIVVGTGDLSELALGWATYNGDHMSMYGVNASVPKTLMQHIVRWVALNSKDNTKREILLDITETPISPELIPVDENNNIKQKTEDLVGPYELHDFFLYHFIRNGYSPEKIQFLALKAFKERYDDTIIKKWLATFMRRFFIQQFKRSCMPDGPVTGKCNLSPQGGWLMPADISGILWNDACKRIE